MDLQRGKSHEHESNGSTRRQSREMLRMKMALAEVLHESLMDEYMARDTYRKIIDTFGPIRPFINIVEAEQAHIELLLPLFQKYGIPLPPEPDLDRIGAPDSLLEACRTAIAAEVANVALYEQLMIQTDLPDVLEVLRRLQSASRDNHLPAFQRCADRGGVGERDPRSRVGRRRWGRQERRGAGYGPERHGNTLGY
jgi:hypothetical protein